MAKKKTTIGVYKRPSEKDIAFYKEKEWGTPKCFLNVYTGRDDTPVTLRNGDKLVFTKSEDKLKQLETFGKDWSEAKKSFVSKMFSDPTVIAEVTLETEE